MFKYNKIIGKKTYNLKIGGSQMKNIINAKNLAVVYIYILHFLKKRKTFINTYVQNRINIEYNKIE